MYCFSFSVATQLRPFLAHASISVPLPANGIYTTPPFLLCPITSLSAVSYFFCVLCDVYSFFVMLLGMSQKSLICFPPLSSFKSSWLNIQPFSDLQYHSAYSVESAYNLRVTLGGASRFIHVIIPLKYIPVSSRQPCTLNMLL